jgi:cytochrome c-type protein NapB
MRRGDAGATGLLLLLFLIGSGLTATVALIVAAERAPAHHAVAPAPRAVPRPVPAAAPIAAEAQVFRTSAAALAIQPEAARERKAHPRTLKTYRYLRAYPGAPPRIPHGLTPTEFRTAACRTCHERGGYSERFAAYAPVTPHPEMGMCLQCHVGDDGITGIQRPSSDPNARCPQCHGRGGPPRIALDATPGWRTTAWVQPTRNLPDGSPPPIPHDLQGRGNCLACHAGPAAVGEIRTTHPEWTDCRQCHLAVDAGAETFIRPTPDGLDDAGGVR